MVEYACDRCDALFELAMYVTITQRCPECFRWDAHPVEGPHEGDFVSPWGESV